MSIGGVAHATDAAPNDVAVVVVTHNSADVLPSLLGSLPAGMAGVDRWELVVVDNDSRDHSIAVVTAAVPSATVVATGSNLGYAAGINIGIRAASPCRAVLVLNPDLSLGAGFAASLLRRLGVAAAGVVAPRIHTGDGRQAHSLRRDPTIVRALGEALLGGDRAGRWPALGEIVTSQREYDSAHTADWASGAALLVSTECLERVGGWDESFFLYCEETDFQLRARDAGFTVDYEPDARCVHLEGRSHLSAHLWSILTVNRVRFYARRHGRTRALAYTGAVVLNEALRSLAGRRVHRAALVALVRPSRRPPEIGRRDRGPRVEGWR